MCEGIWRVKGEVGVYPICYEIKALNEAQKNYTVTEQYLFVVVFAFEKLRSYLLGTRVIVHTDHFALRYFTENKDVKPRFNLWVILLKEFDFEVKYIIGTENQVVDHLSRLEDELYKICVKRHKLTIPSLMSIYWPLLMI